jgi:ABC-2 type transport system ATP-binding protein
VVSAELAGQPLGLDRLPGIHDLDVDGLAVTCRVDSQHLDGLLRALTTVGVRSLTSRPPSLEELFLSHYRQDVPVGSAR